MCIIHDLFLIHICVIISLKFLESIEFRLALLTPFLIVLFKTPQRGVLSNFSNFCLSVRASVCLSLIIQACEHISS